MRLFPLLFAFLFLLGCNKHTSEKSTVIFVINNISYNLTVEAYEDLSAYLLYLEEYYAGEENPEEIIKVLKEKIASGLDKNQNGDNVVSKDDLDNIIEDIQEEENAGLLPIVPSVPDIESMSKAPITILAYLVANNNLDDDLLANIGTMYDGLADMDREATLLVYWDGKTKIGSNDASHLILKYQTDGQGNVNGLPALEDATVLDDVLDAGVVAKEYSSQLSTDKGVMTQVLKDMIALAPTPKVGLVVGSHASSWLNTIFMSRSFGQDGSGTDNTIKIPDMVSALMSSGRKFEFVLFDACFMGTAEISYAFRNVADYQIASVMEVPAYGFPYDVFMKHLYEGSVEGYQKVCDAYTQFYAERYKSGMQAWATISLVDSKEVQSLTGLINQEITSHKNALADYDISVLQEYGRQGGPDIAYDLEHFVKDLNGGTVPSAFKAQLDKTVIYKGSLDKARPSNYSVDPSNYCGMGIYIPIESRSKWNTYFQTIDWFTASGWNTVDFSWNF